MAVGQQGYAVWRAVTGPVASRQSRRRLIVTGFAGLLLGFGGVAAGTSLVQASERMGIFGLFFGTAEPEPQVVAPPRRIQRFASLPRQRRITDTQRGSHAQAMRTPRPSLDMARGPKSGRDGASGAETSSAGNAAGARTVCVRTCDGYLFPLGQLRSKSDLPIHKAACAAACPNASTALFTVPSGDVDLEKAVSLKGTPYLASAWANVYRGKRVENCSCHRAGVAEAPMSIGLDRTLRPGDVVTTEGGADVVTKVAKDGIHLRDYRTGQLSRTARREIDRKVGALDLAYREAAFRKALRKSRTALATLRAPETKGPQTRFVEVAAEPAPDGASASRVVMRSPYER